ncbi:hypothetical protein JQ616_20500 [Bradyrhizobium tropiciagri]|uniref:DUF6894 family protein n=1 Tax=Bradyrhizobium tropiciagri TaxID=312253 RepID=UPI001BA78AA0|nr:hypothetical protein [Bradyrhizobium tropiciagri]MBR0897343.1 hypothetical protein [Bradyrhizobium tropiciagri]
MTELSFMPRYYFDFRDDEAASLDKEGIDLRSLAEAQEEAALALADFARSTLADPLGAKSDRELSVSVRDERGTILAKCVFGIDRPRE